MRTLVVAIGGLLCSGWLTLMPVYAADSAPFLDYQIVQVEAHDPPAFTQGLVQRGDLLVETSGLYGESYIVQYHAVTGKKILRRDLPDHLFAEGITWIDDVLYMLTWKAGKMWVMDAHSLETKRVLRYAGEGWGLTDNGRQLVMSNGSNQLLFRCPDDFSIQRTLSVREGTRAWSQLNELEYAQGLIWANVWMNPMILAIDPSSGSVVAKVDFSSLVKKNSTNPAHTVLNGIAYDAESQTYWITGKHWPRRYRVAFNWPEDEASGPAQTGK